MKRIKKRIWIPLVVVLILCIWYISIQPSHDRIWSADQQVLPYAVLHDTHVDLFYIRNISYYNTTTYNVSHYNATFAFDELVGLWYMVEYFHDWKGMAHTLLSFEFSDGTFVSASVEIRKEQGETYSPLKGVLKQFELMYVWADEQDVIQLRTNHRNNDVYLYPVNISPQGLQFLFVDMLTRTNALYAQPEFYNTLTSTCTSNLVRHINKIAPQRVSPFDIRVLFPGYSDTLAYNLGFFGTEYTLDDLRQHYYITDKAQEESSVPFSKRIRQ
ncbi:MAG: DUF4105 domain-containing protein [Candidatus Woesearchaeota archaeon]